MYKSNTVTSFECMAPQKPNIDFKWKILSCQIFKFFLRTVSFVDFPSILFVHSEETRIAVRRVLSSDDLYLDAELARIHLKLNYITTAMTTTVLTHFHILAYFHQIQYKKLSCVNPFNICVVADLFIVIYAHSPCNLHLMVAFQQQPRWHRNSQELTQLATIRQLSIHGNFMWNLWEVIANL